MSKKRVCPIEILMQFTVCEFRGAIQGTALMKQKYITGQRLWGSQA